MNVNNRTGRPGTRPRNRRLLAWLLLAAGTAILALSFWTWNRAANAPAPAAQYPGVVVELERTGNDLESGRRPIVEFSPAPGIERMARASWARNPPGYEVGDAAIVLCEASAADARCDVYQPGGPWALVMILVVFAAVCFATAAMWLLPGRQ